MFEAWHKHARQLKIVGALLALLGSLALVWFTIQAPERGRNALVTAMENDAARFFATERDIGALARDTKSGAARSIGLSPEYALVSLGDGGRYYVRIDTQRALVTELLKERMAAASPEVFSLGEISRPSGRCRRFRANSTQATCRCSDRF